jgi:hypothetical protein
MNRREAFAAALGAVCAAMLPRPAGGLEADISRIFGVEPAVVPRVGSYQWLAAEEARFCREVVGPLQRRLGAAMAEKIDRDWLEKPA